MIISYRHRFIFIHCRKVAGSSIKRTLWPLLGDDDLMVGSYHELPSDQRTLNRGLRKRLRTPSGLLTLSFAGARNLVWRRDQANSVNSAVKASFGGRLGDNPVHPPAERVRRCFPEEWATFFKFCFVRNSYEQALSEYFFQKRLKGFDMSFLAFLQAQDDRRARTGPTGVLSNWSLYSINDHVEADYIGRFESLSEDFRAVSRQLGLPESAILAQSKRGGYGRDDLPGYFGPDEVSIIQRLYAKEISHFNFQPPGANGNAR